MLVLLKELVFNHKNQYPVNNYYYDIRNGQ